MTTKNNWNLCGTINKFKSGTINLKADLQDFDIEKFYESMTNNDLYFNQINGYMYLQDTNTNKLYDFSDCYINILKFLESKLSDGKTLKLYPLDKKTTKSLLQDLENGF